MKKLLIFLGSFVLLSAGISPAFAKTYNVDAKAGRSTLIGVFVLGDRHNCTATNPGTAKVRSEPKHGKIQLIKETWIPSSGQCKGRRLLAWKFIYRGNGKPDFVSIAVSSTYYEGDIGNKTWFRKYKINH